MNPLWRMLAVAAFAALFGGDVRAQIFAPGPLSKAHASLEGVSNCVKCHGEGSQHDNARCLDCHSEIQRRKDARTGYHARLGAQSCAECHAEHRGQDANIVEFKPSQRGFDHKLTGWPLEGAHRKNDCKKCHEARLVTASDARKLLADGRHSFLGLSTTCVSCHFDEHRKQEGNDCAKCHTPESFEKAPRFNHTTMSSFPLTGKHSAVDCKKCHGNLSDDTTPADAFPAPKSRTYLQMKDIPHTSCTDCHDDVHNGSFGRNCTQCHSTADWRTILKTAEDFGFHDKTKFPLRGMHTDVACKTCHGPFGAQKAVFKGLKHDRCTDCHTDAHVGQLDKDDKGAVPCEKCHTVSGFLPVLFDLTAHARTRFALDGSHKAVACNACHTADEKMARRVPAAVKARLDFQRRRLLVSDARLELPNLKRLSDAESSAFRCESCHENPHADQFDEAIAARGCNGCHLTTTFREETFHHDDSRFPLTGKHAGVACGKCHAEESLKAKKKKPSTGPATMVRYRPIAMECATCHADEHVGQLARDGSTDCKRCHQTTGFSPSTFRHDDPAQTRFVLEGKHKEVKCARCHVAVHVPGVDDDGKTTARYKPIATDCRSCHDDEHNGGFDRFTP